MTKEVLISICGLQFESDDEDRIESITSGIYYPKEHSQYIVFEEATEGFEESTKNTIKFQEGFLSLTKRGLMNVNMIFEKNKKTMTNYATPYGDILIGIDTRKVELTEEDEKISILVEYSLDVNYEHLADCNLTIHIWPKESGIHGNLI